MVTLLLHSASVLIVPSSSPDSGGCFSHREPRSVSPTCLSDERLGQTSDVPHNKYVHNVTQSRLKAFYTDRGTSGKQHGELCDVETIGTEAASDGDVGYHSIGSGDHEQTILAGSRETDRQRVPHKQTFPMMGSRSTSSYFAQATRTDVGRYDADVISGVGRCQRVVVDVRYDDYCPTISHEITHPSSCQSQKSFTRSRPGFYRLENRHRCLYVGCLMFGYIQSSQVPMNQLISSNFYRLYYILTHVD